MSKNHFYQKLRGEIEPVRPVRVHSAGNCLGILWALIELTEQNKVHTKSNIKALFPNFKLSNPTIGKWLDFLEKWGVIKAKYKKGNRQGKRDQRFFDFRPERVPPLIWNQRIPDSTLHRWKATFAETIGSWEDGLPCFDARKFIDLDIQKFFDFLATKLEDETETKTVRWDSGEAKKWFIKNLDGEIIELDGNILVVFHCFICCKVKNWQSESNI